MTVIGELGTVQRLRGDHDEAFERVLTHPLISGIVEGSLAPGVFTRFVGYRLYFLRAYRRLHMLAGMQAPKARISALIFSSTRDIDHEIVQAEAYLLDAGGSTDIVPSRAEMDYTSFCLAVTASGWTQALAVMYTVETLFHGTWATLAERLPVDHPCRDALVTWSRHEQGSFVAELTRLLDGQYYSVSLSTIVGDAIELETQVWSDLSWR